MSLTHITQFAALIAIMGTAVVYGTDVFCAMVLRPALARVDDEHGLRTAACLKGSGIAPRLLRERQLQTEGPGRRCTQRLSCSPVVSIAQGNAADGGSCAHCKGEPDSARRRCRSPRTVLNEWALLVSGRAGPSARVKIP